MSFDHREPGTPAADWDARFDSALLDLDGVTGVVVLAPHPDDETLGAGGLIATLAARGIPAAVVLATLGENSHPGSPTHTPSELAAVRRSEFEAATDALGPEVRRSVVGVPDGCLDDGRDAITAALEAELEFLGSTPLLVAPWHGDGHRDHRIGAEIAQALAARRGLALLEYPIWLWHWGGGDDGDAPWARAATLPLDDAARARKSAALEAYASQIAPLSPAVEDSAILHPGMQAHFERPAELFFSSQSRSAQHFDEHYARHPGGWDFDESWYERRKRGLLLAALPRERFHSALELGCATGALTAALAERCEAILGVDAAASAIDAAHTRAPGLRFEQRMLPHEWPDGRFDLVVVSEVGYYLAPADLTELVSRAVESLDDDGVLVLCHWRHPDSDAVMSGDAVHDAVVAGWRGTRLVHHEEPDFVLDVLSVRPENSVAREQGLLP